MRRVTYALFAAALALAPADAARAQQQQHPATGGTTQQKNTSGVLLPKPPPAAASVKAKYEGGVAGYAKGEGTLNFDDANQRLVFRNKKGQEVFSVPYRLVHTAWADVRSQRSTTGTVIAHAAPYGLGLPGLWMKSTTRYINLRYRDGEQEGAASFKLDNKETLASFIHTFADKAGLTQRGDYFTRNPSPSTIPTVRTRVIDN